MSTKPSFFSQQTETSCAVACLRMVLATFGIEQTEEELRRICDCGIRGTDALKIVDAARQVGLANTRKYNLTIGELIAELGKDAHPIVYVQTYIKGVKSATKHAFVVLDISPDMVTVLDPWEGERQIARVQFEHDWQLMRGRTILCQK